MTAPLYDLRLGNALTVLKTLDAESVHCCITSPPYYALRDYGNPPVEWGDGSSFPLGLEDTPARFVRHIVEIFREVRRVLRRDGTLWLNMGDGFAGSCQSGGAEQARGGGGKGKLRAGLDLSRAVRAPIGDGLKSKDLMGIPWECALALRRDGWYLRCDCVWAKENPLPESVKDRPARSHEYLFLLTRSARYWYDAEAVKEPVVLDSLRETKRVPRGQQKGSGEGIRHTNERMPSHHQKIEVDPDGRNMRSVISLPVQPFLGSHFAVMPERLVEPCVKAGCPPGGICLDPFAGSGTVGVVALQHGRRFLGIEMQAAYLPLIAERLARYEGLGVAPEEATIKGPRTLSLGI